MVCFRYYNNRLNFSLSYLVILFTLVQRNDMLGSMSGFTHFATHINFATIECRMFASFFYSLVERSYMFCRHLFAGNDTFVLSYYTNKSIDSSMQSFINKDNFPSAKNSMSIPRSLCFSPLDTVRLPKCSAIVSINFLFNYSSTCDTLLSLTYNDIVHCLSLMVILTMYLSYGLITKSCDFRVFEYRSYHSIAEYMHPYWAFRSCRYNTFTQLSTRKCFLCLGFTLHMMSKNLPSILNIVNLSSGISVLRYAPGTSKIAAYIPLCASIISLVNRASRDMVGYDALYLGM